MRGRGATLCIAVLAGGCGGAYKDALCKLSSSSVLVATHYSEYVAAETNAMTKAAREAEAKQFKKAVDEGQLQCNH